MITIKVPIKGGLGNQMFGYAYSLFLKDRGYKVCLLWRDYLFTKQHNGVELELAFKICLNQSSRIKILLCSFFNRLFQISILKKIVSKIIKEIDRLFNKNIYQQPSPYYYDESQFHKNTLANGFWQNCNYLEPLRTEILNVFSFRLPNNYEAKSVVQSILNSESVAVHIRRGDYLAKEFSDYNVFGEDVSYHSSAIDLLKKELPNSVFFFFSDDLIWCKNKFQSDRFVFVDENKGSNSYLDMYLMSLCKHIIISNSTFSWWGAYLHKSYPGTQRYVVAPKFWTKDGIETSSFSPSSWIFL